MKVVLRGGAWCCAWILIAGPSFAEETARQWLDAMHDALAARNYQGEFLHVANGRIEKLRIVHRVKDGHVAERLVSVGGSGREVIRHDTELQCILPDERKVLVDTQSDPGSLLGTLPSFEGALETNYRLDLGDRAVVLGRPVRVLSVTPRDALRFGYRLWIDEENHMPMRTDLCDADGHVLEQVLFTALRVGGTIADTAFHPDVDLTGFSWARPGGTATRPLTGAELGWRLGDVPSGFRLSASTEQRLPGSDRPVTHLVLSDGLASVSVFIEEPTAPRQATEGQGRVGSAFAYSRVVAGHQVTAVGEVPAQTVEQIAAGVEPAKPRRMSFGAAAALSAGQTPR